VLLDPQLSALLKSRLALDPILVGKMLYTHAKIMHKETIPESYVILMRCKFSRIFWVGDSVIRYPIFDKSSSYWENCVPVIGNACEVKSGSLLHDW
jgi:hypothetical protein